MEWGCGFCVCVVGGVEGGWMAWHVVGCAYRRLIMICMMEWDEWEWEWMDAFLSFFSLLSTFFDLLLGSNTCSC
jgi:hypothetical protein